ncbi:pre-mRNA-splicing factor 18 [Bradysia coprophila]|uniref:pre-mRNA-splicing factor 18 n=1 Tax=Bradysia coprophila TaxID=38358 RepID=UPI00187DC83B|nr:pre-mRNA-splicing factor 18 [Bradysia coprophila]XP_037027115.1 pre-mRNA-splicing factor 18 [Bradysia coprophila]
MEILKAEIARKRKLLEDKKLVDESKKYFKRGDLLAKEEEEYLQKYGHKEENTSPQKNTNYATTSTNESDQQLLPRLEVIKRLRDRGEAIMLFGEDELDAFRRLRHLEITQPEVNHGFRNDFQEAMDQVDQQYLDEILACSEEIKQNKSDKVNDEIVIDDSVTYDQIQEMAKNLGRNNKDHDHMVISTFLEFILKMWHTQVNSYSQTERMSTNVKIARATCAQTKVYMKPLLRKLKKKTLPEDILDSLTDITKRLLNRNYIKASDAYLQMAIGNSPWPIGVTMVGIHARTGREKIFSKNVAHVMNDETQRKYIQGLKRLMTKCQEYFPTDPSRCVEYVSKKDQCM